MRNVGTLLVCDVLWPDDVFVCEYHIFMQFNLRILGWILFIVLFCKHSLGILPCEVLRMFAGQDQLFWGRDSKMTSG